MKYKYRVQGDEIEYRLSSPRDCDSLMQQEALIRSAAVDWWCHSNSFVNSPYVFSLFTFEGEHINDFIVTVWGLGFRIKLKEPTCDTE